MEKPTRKPNRLKNYDYAQNGAYFLTICSKDRIEIFSKIPVGANIVRPELSEIGIYVEKSITQIHNVYDNVDVDNYVIMPNHVHMILTICESNTHGRTMFAPTNTFRRIGKIILNSSCVGFKTANCVRTWAVSA